MPFYFILRLALGMLVLVVQRPPLRDGTPAISPVMSYISVADWNCTDSASALSLPFHGCADVACTKLRACFYNSSAQAIKTPPSF